MVEAELSWESEVCQFYAIKTFLLMDKDVIWLQVPVHDTLDVAVFQALKNLPKNGFDLI